MSITWTYLRYIEALPAEKKCACGRHLRSRCPLCNQPKSKEERIDENPQLSLFPETPFSLYNTER
jgi:hypothetical protein